MNTTLNELMVSARREKMERQTRYVAQVLQSVQEEVGDVVYEQFEPIYVKQPTFSQIPPIQLLSSGFLPIGVTPRGGSLKGNWYTPLKKTLFGWKRFNVGSTNLGEALVPKRK